MQNILYSTFDGIISLCWNIDLSFQSKMLKQDDSDISSNISCTGNVWTLKENRLRL